MQNRMLWFMAANAVGPVELYHPRASGARCYLRLDGLWRGFVRVAAARASNVRFSPILLRKSFWGGERKFLEPLMRFMRGNVRGHIVSSKIDHQPPHWR